MAGAEGTRKALCDESPYELGVFWEIGEPIGIRHRNQEREAESGATKTSPFLRAEHGQQALARQRG